MFNKHGKYNVEVDINRNQNGKEECCHVFDENPNKTYGIVIILKCKYQYKRNSCD